MIYSDLSDFFERVADVPRPELHDDLQHHAPGCYATVSRVKNGIRRAESSLVAAESYSMLARTLLSKNYPTDRFADAWREVCFCHFHDSMDGCSVAPVYEDAAQMLGFARHTAAVAENNALQTISWATDTSDRSRGLPVFVFNPHAYPVEQVVTANVHYAGVTDSEGNPIPTQNTVSPALPCSGRSDTTFRASVPAMGYAVYYLTEQNGAAEQPVTVSATPRVAPLCAGRGDGPVLENEFWRIQFEDYTGYISSMIDKQSGENILSGRAAVPTVIDEFYHDTWSHAKSYFTDVMARFSDATVTVTENGPVRATVKVVSRYNGSTVTLRFSLCAGDPTLHMSGEVDWHEKHKMLKLAFPLRVDNPVADYEIPFGVMRRPADGEEEPGLGFVAVRNEQSGAGYAFLNDSSYSTSIAGGTVYLTVLRSPIFADHGGERNADSAYTEQGVRPFRYAMMPVDGSNAAPVKAARLLNAPMSVVVENWHEGVIKATSVEGLSVSADNVVVSALKRAEDGSGVVVRLYETDGKQTEVTVSGCVLSQPIRTTLRGFGMKTLLLGDDGSCREVLLTEFDK
jgi:alpha-mannosidase